MDVVSREHGSVRLSHKAAYLDLDEFLDAVNNEDMFLAIGTQTDDGLVTGVHPPILESFLGCFFIVQIAEDNAWAADHEFTGGVVGGNFLVLGGNDAHFDAGDQAAGRSQEHIIRVCRADDGRCFGKAFTSSVFVWRYYLRSKVRETYRIPGG